MLGLELKRPEHLLEDQRNFDSVVIPDSELIRVVRLVEDQKIVQPLLTYLAVPTARFALRVADRSQ